METLYLILWIFVFILGLVFVAEWGDNCSPKYQKHKWDLIDLKRNRALVICFTLFSNILNILYWFSDWSAIFWTFAGQIVIYGLFFLLSKYMPHGKYIPRY